MITLKRENGFWTEDGVALSFDDTISAGTVYEDFKNRHPNDRCRMPSHMFGPMTYLTFGEYVELKAASEA